MITISRLFAKEIRSVFRRALQITASHNDQIVWLLADDTGLRVRAQDHHAIAEHHQPGKVAPDSLPVTMESLAACEGTKADEFVSVELRANGAVVLRWEDRSIPQSFQVDAKKVRADPSPALPETWSNNPPRLLNAISDAMKILPGSVI